jgi:quinol monooxygenase YgiN
VSEHIVYVDRSEVREGRLEDLKTATKELAQFVEANEPRLVSYEVYFDEGGTRMTVIHVHRDSESLEFHMNVAGPLFAPFAELVRLSSIDVYGRPGDAVVRQLQRKAEMLGGATVTVHGHHAGFARLASA